MTAIRKFNELTERLLEEEEDRLLNSESVDRALLQDIKNAISLGEGSSDSFIKKAIAQREEAFSILEKAKSEVHRELQDNKAFDFLMGLALLGLAKLFSKMKSDIEESQELIEGAVETIEAPPQDVPLEEKAAAIDKVIDEYSKLKNASEILEELSGTSREESEDFIQTLKDRLDEIAGTDVAGVEEYFRSTGVSHSVRPEQRIIVVRELRDRFFEIANDTTVKPGNITSSLDSYNDFVVKIDRGDSEAQSILEIAGLENASVSNDGTISIVGGDNGLSQNSAVSLQIFPNNQNIAPRRGTSVNQQVRDTIEAAAADLQEKLGFELWACLLLDLAEKIKQVWTKIKSAMTKAISILNFKKNVINNGPFGKVPPLGTALIGNGAKVKGLLNTVLNPSDAAIDLLGVRSSFLNSNQLLAGNSSICGQNHAKYCDISRNLSAMIRDLFKNLDRFGMKLGNLNIPSWDQDALLDFLNIPFEKLNGFIEEGDKHMNNLFKEICSIIERRLSRAPKSLTGIRAVMLGMLPFILTLQPGLSPSYWGMEENPKFEKIAEQLRKFGYEDMAEELSSGNPMVLLRSRPINATTAGQIATLLRDTAKDTDKNTPRLAAQARLAADAFETIHSRKIISGRVRELVVNRYRRNVSDVLGVQGELSDYGRTVLEQMRDAIGSGVDDL